MGALHEGDIPVASISAEGDETLSAVIAQIFETTTQNGRWPRLLASLQRAFGDTAHVSVWTISPSTGSVRVWSDIAPEFAPQLKGSFDRMIERRDLPRSRLFDLGDLFPALDYRKTPEYSEWLAPLGLSPVWPLVFVSEDRVDLPTVGVVLHRRRSMRPFDEGEVALAARLAPHFVRSQHIRHRIREARRSRLALAEIVERLLPGVIFLDGRGRVVGKNRSAAHILAENRLQLEAGFLTSTNRSENERLRALVRAVTAEAPAATRSEAGRSVMTVADREGASLSLYFVRLMPGTSANDDRTPVACIFIGDPSSSASDGLEDSLRQLFGLTPAEAELVSLLMQGCSLKQIAAIRRSSLNTVRTQIRSVFRKTGTSRQGDLVRLILTAVPGVSDT